jgi:hypothetical protein
MRKKEGRREKGVATENTENHLTPVQPGRAAYLPAQSSSWQCKHGLAALLVLLHKALTIEALAGARRPPKL